MYNRAQNLPIRKMASTRNCEEVSEPPDTKLDEIWLHHSFAAFVEKVVAKCSYMDAGYLLPTIQGVTPLVKWIKCPQKPNS